MVTVVLQFALLFGFWLPTFLVGRWYANSAARAQRRAIPFWAVVLSTSAIWLAIWLVAELLLFAPAMKPQVPRAAGDIDDAGGYIFVGILGWAFYIVLPGSALACWLGTIQHFPSKLRTPLIAIVFIAIQLAVIALLFSAIR